MQLPFLRELRRIDQDLSGAAENALLVVVKVAVTHGEVRAFRADSSAVQVGDGRA